MKKYLISLDKDAHRRELFFSQPDTADFQVFSAINTMKEAPESLAAKFAIKTAVGRYGRALTSGEIGCTLSHLAVYRQIMEDESIRETDFALICEDDALFSPNFQQNLTALLANANLADIVLVGQSKIADFADKELELSYPTTLCAMRQKVGEITIAFPYKSYFAGTVAYLIRKSAARTLVTEAQETSCWLADDFLFFEQAFGLKNQVVRPLMAIENPQLVSNLEAVRGSLSNNVWKKMMKYPLKKLMAIQKNRGK